MTNLTRFVFALPKNETTGSNFSSNACKFTPVGGTVSISTKLILPTSPAPYEQGDASRTSTVVSDDILHQLSATRLTLHDMQQDSVSSLDRIVVRIEVTDTGHGIKASDLAHGRLFSECWVPLIASTHSHGYIRVLSIKPRRERSKVGKVQALVLLWSGK